MPKTKKIFLFGLIGVVCIALVVVYSNLNPESSCLFPKCPFKLLTTLDCPGCGSQRAIHHLLNLEIGSAIRANALLVFAIPYILLLIGAEIWQTKNQIFRRLHEVLYSSKAIWMMFVVVVVWWVLRNVV